MFCSLAVAQKERIQIQGNILNTTDEPLEAVTIFNTSSLEGTVSNENGNLLIHVREGDQLSFKAIQLEPFAINISSKIVDDKKIAISLKNAVNQLDEVFIDNGLMRVKVKQTTPVDPKIDEVSDYNIKNRAVDRIEYTFSDRIKQPEEYAIRNEAFNQSMPGFAMFDIVSGLLGLIGLGINALIQNIDQPKDNDSTSGKEKFDIYVLKNKYSTEYLLEYLQIPDEDLYEFMYFAADAGLNESMFKPENELDLLQFLSNQVTLYKEKKKYSVKTEGK
jgi:hypothetical protein